MQAYIFKDTETGRGECHLETDTQRKNSHVMTEAEIEVMLVQAKECQGLLVTEVRRESMALPIP